MATGARKLYRGNMQESGSITFNAPGTWTTPSRLLSVTVTGLGGPGGTGNPGIAGNGNAGQPGIAGNGSDRKHPAGRSECLGNRRFLWSTG